MKKKNIPMTLGLSSSSCRRCMEVLVVAWTGLVGHRRSCVVVGVLLFSSSCCCRRRPACRRVVVLVVWMCGCCCRTRVHQCVPTLANAGQVIDGRAYILS